MFELVWKKMGDGKRAVGIHNGRRFDARIVPSTRGGFIHEVRVGIWRADGYVATMEQAENNCLCNVVTGLEVAGAIAS